MTADQRLALILSAMAIIFIPLLGLIVRITIKWTRVEDKLSELVADIDQLVRDKDATHNEIVKQMGDDRKATDRRLRWLEENVWFRGKNNQ